MKTLKNFFYLILIGGIVAGGYRYFPLFEWRAPLVDIKLPSGYIGLRPFEVEIRDEGSGLKSASVSLVAGGVETLIADKSYPAGVTEDKITVEIDRKNLNPKGGEAEIVVRAEDRSKLRFFSGNSAVVNKRVAVDFTPPKVEILSREHYINHGGSGLVIYKTSDDAVRSGVKIGDYFFPGHRGYFKQPDVYLAFFAYPYNVDPSAPMNVVAEDGAGNQKQAGFFYKLRGARYKKSTINISADFVLRKIAPILGVDPADESEYKNFFLKVNRNLRQSNDAQIKKLAESSAGKFLWTRAFHQLSNSQVEANFADERTYTLNGEAIDLQYHLGYDLAVTRQYPIEAANDGAVLFSGDLGIYGNTVIIDHGFGIMTLYGHMSSITTNVGDAVKKGQSIGRTGETGLAAGDHLHYGVYIDGVAVRPVEWWDDKWIADNLINKLREAEGEFGLAEGQVSPVSPDSALPPVEN
ncbi:MAG: M23 family metallopeptidase [Deltaproteobacteria bacterium]